MNNAAVYVVVGYKAMASSLGKSDTLYILSNTKTNDSANKIAQKRTNILLNLQACHCCSEITNTIENENEMCMCSSYNSTLQHCYLNSTRIYMNSHQTSSINISEIWKLSNYGRHGSRVVPNSYI